MSDILIYKNADGTNKIDVRLEEETVWLTQAQLCELFQKSKATISEHIKNVFEEGELELDSTVRKYRTVQVGGSRNVERELDYFNLDLIISVGYRVKSPQGTRLSRQLSGVTDKNQKSITIPSFSPISNDFYGVSFPRMKQYSKQNISTRFGN